jgi:hypothetical protein
MRPPILSSPSIDHYSEDRALAVAQQILCRLSRGDGPSKLLAERGHRSDSPHQSELVQNGRAPSLPTLMAAAV